MKPSILSKFLYFSLVILLAGACQTGKHSDKKQQSEWLERTEGFQEKYALEQIVVLSRHNIRTPMTGKGSVLSRITDPANQWFPWVDPASHLTAKGERLEALMGAFFREWLEKKDFTGQYTADNGSFRFYANAKQRCQLTARTFADAVFPGKSPEVEMQAAFDTMDPVFNPQITKLPDGFAEKARQEIADRMGDIDAHIASQYELLEEMVGMSRSPAYPDTSAFSQFPSSVGFQLQAEPFMSGGLKMGYSVSDALVLQYYEEPDSEKAAFYHPMQADDWVRTASVKEWYGDVLFTAPSVAVNVAHPLLQTLLSELRQDKRLFTFLCGHDSNIGSVLASLEAQPYELPQSIEKHTPIGSKIVIETFKAKDGTEYADLWLVYASTTQLREETALSYAQPPMALRLQLKGLTENADRLYLLSDLEQRFEKAIAAYDLL